jgi:predicted amidohydrolase
LERADFVDAQGEFSTLASEQSEALLVRSLLKAEEHSADIVVFPELCISRNQLDAVRTWTAANKSLVIAGTHYHSDEKGRFNRCPISFNGEIQYQDKIVTSPREKTVYTSVRDIIGGDTLRIFENSPAGRLGVLICADFLEPEIRTKAIELQLDIVFIVAMQGDSSRYHPVVNSLIDESKGGLYAIYCNSAVQGISDGNSGLFGVIDRRLYGSELQRSGQFDERYPNLICQNRDHNILVISVSNEERRPTVRHTHHSAPNVKIIAMEKLQNYDAFPLVAARDRPNDAVEYYQTSPILEQVKSLLAKHGFDDPDWLRAFSSMVFVDRLAHLLGQTETPESIALQTEFLSFFNIGPTDKIELKNEKVLVTDEEKEGILLAMRAEDEVEPAFARIAKMRAGNTNIEVMHRNYLYAVVLAISGPKQSRIMRAIREMAVDYFFSPGSKSQEALGGWIPYRTPWITARVLISLGGADLNGMANKESINLGVARALESLQVRANADGLWRSGAGSWVTNWEATALSIEAIVMHDSEKRYVRLVRRAIQCCLSLRQQWLDALPAVDTPQSSNLTLGAVMLASAILRAQERYLTESAVSVDEVNSMYGFLSKSIQTVAQSNSSNTLQYCTIPQIASYCLEVVSA